MTRILIFTAALISFFLVFASNYSALDGGNHVGVAIGLGGMFLTLVTFVIVILVDVIKWLRDKLRRP